MHPVGKTMRRVTKLMTPFIMGTMSSITMQSLGKIAECATAVGAKIWCFFFVCLCVCWSRSESGAPCVWGVHSSNKHCVAVYCPISTRFTAFFWISDPSLPIHYITFIGLQRWLREFTWEHPHCKAVLGRKFSKSRQNRAPNGGFSRITGCKW